MNKFIFFLKRPRVILIIGENRIFIKEIVSWFLSPKALILESVLSEPKEIKNFNFFLKKSKLPILVIGDIKNTEDVKELVRVLPAQGFLILNFDDEAARQIRKELPVQSLTYGFQEGADLKATDINISPEGTNFKINYEGNIVPFWLKNLFGKEQVYSVLAAACVGVVKDMNLVEISQALK